MVAAKAVRVASGSQAARGLYDRIGEFLVDQRLDPDPANYAFAYQLLANPDGPLARAVHMLTDGGVRLTRRDIETLGCDAPVAGTATATIEKAQGLVAQTQMQVEGFQDIVTAMRADAKDFGRDLEASAQAMRRSGGDDLEVTKLTATMLERVRYAEERLETANREANELRTKLEEARDNARKDPLTGLANRRAFEEAYAAEAAKGTRMSMAVCDVDYFKSVNDRFGHVVGDRVLKALGEALSDTCKGHLVARYGGEEFVVLFTGLDIKAARDVLERARIAVSAKRYRLRETDAPLGEITFSAGLSPAVQGEVFGTVFHRADQLCYAAKNGGRNCIRID
ncbi:GGDEF domain-containing protein [Sphingomonas sp. R-74633]|uniref:GGDEF domain-containing protein n=1 Tax=Sphingomonas sp. R-74633 TaxID=2751188 RepID=UPI0015D3D715|nr:GGDEF domain-containing protein [Sphingomonas sp. R-74633]NYT42352.1 GGDEF domain-containing protein [Sphingomonas sp. R-74633]